MTTNKKTPAATEETLYLYDEIGVWGIGAEQFVNDLNEIDSDVIHLRINSPGGDVFAAKAMQTALAQHDANIIAHVDGLAASAASVVAMGADEIEMVDGGFMMIHKALSFFDVFGYFNDDNLKDLKKEMTKILFDQGYILSYKIIDDKVQDVIKIALKYDKNSKESVIRNLERVSTPGLRQY